MRTLSCTETLTNSSKSFSIVIDPLLYPLLNFVGFEMSGFGAEVVVVVVIVVVVVVVVVRT